MNKFLTSFASVTNYTLTENGAEVYETSSSAIVDLFGQLGAMRNAGEDQILALFYKAFHEDPTLAVRTVFYTRDVRGGQGERRVFRIILKDLAMKYPKVVEYLIPFVPEYGRYDDLFVLFDTPVERQMVYFIENVLVEDVKSGHPTLLAKWMPSENASSAETRKMARKFISYFKWSSRQYRKTLSFIRNRLNIVERYMSQKKFSEINYSSVPSQAMLKYSEAFLRNDGDRFRRYLEDVANNKAKMNMSVSTPDQIVRSIIGGGNIDFCRNAWSSLPNYIDQPEESICVVDVSGSMQSYDVLHVAVALGIYISERNQGPFKDHFITFSERPKLHDLSDMTIDQKVRYILRNPHLNTNIQAVFQSILEAAVSENLSQEEMVKRVYILSDMEFDVFYKYQEDRDKLFNLIRKEYEYYGYELPELVFWALQKRNTHMPMKYDENGVLFVSGYNPVIIKYLLNRKFLTGLDLVKEVVNSPRYSVIEVSL